MREIKHPLRREEKRGREGKKRSPRECPDHYRSRRSPLRAASIS